MQVWNSSMQGPVRDHIPLKQGLRRSNIAINVFSERVRDHIPLKQGLRLLDNLRHHFLTPASETIFH